MVTFVTSPAAKGYDRFSLTVASVGAKRQLVKAASVASVADFCPNRPPQWWLSAPSRLPLK
jgi:hypothetical protein